MTLLLLLSTACTTETTDSFGGDTGDCKVFTWYRDEDGDGHGNAMFATEDCDRPNKYSPEDDDCDDQDKSKWNDCPGWDCVELGSYDHPAGDSESEWRSIYHGCDLLVGWQDSRQRCYDAFDGGDLAASNTIEEFSKLQELAVGLDTDDTYWFGLFQQSTAPSVDFGWDYVGSSDHPESDDVENGGVWHVGQPDNGGYVENEGGDLEEDVAVLYAVDEVWALGDSITGLNFGYICEVQGVP